MSKGWIGVDFDGTLAHYETWMEWNVFGEPIEPMVARIKQWLSDGVEVRIVTARVGFSKSAVSKCRITGQSFTGHDMERAIRDWCRQHVGQALPVQCHKDVHMIELWDDCAVQVVPNTGQTVAEEWEARYNAAMGKVAGNTLEGPEGEYGN